MIRAATLASALALSLALPAATVAAPAPDPSAALHWRLVGPHRAGWSTMVEGVPAQPDTFLFGAAGGGVWKTIDAGRTWSPIFNKGPAAIGAIAVAPSNPEVVYVGTGHPEPRYDVQAGEGVFRTSDGGRTWQDLGLKTSRHIGRIWVDPRNADTVVVAAVGPLFGSGGERGVFRSTDGGRTWRHTLDLGPDAGVVDVASDPGDPNTLYAAAWQARVWPWLSYFTPVAGEKSGLYKSTDGGVTWTRLAGQGWPAGALGRTGLAVTRKAGQVRLYATVDAKAASGLYRSDDGGGHWVRANDETAMGGWYFSRLTVDPRDPDVVFGVGQSIRRCTDAGARCEIVKGAPGGDDYHFVWINPLHPERMATASDQGTVISVDAGRTWSSWYNQPTGQFYHLAADTRFPYWIYSGQQDSGTVGIASRSDFGALTFRDWHPVGGDERDYDIPDPNDPYTVYASGLGGRVSRFDARTGQSADVSAWPEENYGKRPTTTAHHFVWITPLVASKTGPTSLYLGGDVVFRSRDRGDHWQVISPDLTGKHTDAATARDPRCGGDVAISEAKRCGYGAIFSLQTSPRHPDELWVGTDDGLVQMTRDDGAHWTDVTPKEVPEWAKVSSVDVSALADGVAYIAVDDHRQNDFRPRIFATRDYGAHWREATAGLPDGHYVSVVRADPVRAGLLYAGTDAGVYVSYDDGARWSPLQLNLPNAWVRDLLVHGDDLLAATQGRALWVLDDVTPLRQRAALADARSPRLLQPATAVRAHGDNNHDTPLPPEEPQSPNPPEGVALDYWLPADARHVALEIRDEAGRVVRRLTEEAPEQPNAERYFAAAWVRPAAGLSRTAGMHRAWWDLRHERPKAFSYGYSIAAVMGEDTPTTPQGPWAVPGRYTVDLVVDGKRQSQPLTMVEDPRVQVSAADLKASLVASERIARDLDAAVQGLGERQAARAQLKALAAVLNTGGRTDAQLAADVTCLLSLVDDTTPACSRFAASDLRSDAAFTEPASVLAGVETDLERADKAPTAAQLDLLSRTEAELQRARGMWTGLRDGPLADLNRRLVAAGRKPVVFTPQNTAVHLSAGGGEDLP